MKPETKAMNALAAEATALLKTLAHPARLIICCQLRDCEMSVGDMEAQLGVKQPRLSRELAKLREEGLVETRRESKVIFYRLSDAPRVREMIDSICAVMLNKRLPQALAGDKPGPASRRGQVAGGYAEFARVTIDPERIQR